MARAHFYAQFSINSGFTMLSHLHYFYYFVVLR